MNDRDEILKLKKLNKSLKLKNAELKETLRSIQSGEVDALVVAGPMGDRVFTLQSAEQPYRELIEAMNEGAISLSPDGIILYCNSCFQAMTQTSSEKLIGSDIRAHVRPESRKSVELLLSRGRKLPASFEVLLHVEKKAPIRVQFSASSIGIAGRNAFCVVATDLSKTNQNLETMKQHEWLTTILNLLPVPLVLLGSNLNDCRFINTRASELLGCLPTDEMSLPVHSSVLNFENEKGEGLELKSLIKKLCHSQQPIEVILCANGKKLSVLLHSKILPAAHGQEAARILILEDFSRFKKVQNDLAVALRGRDQFLAALSHELRTPLNVILGWVQLLRASPNDPNIVSQAIDILDRNAELQRDLIEDLLDMSRILTGNLVIHLKPMDLKTSVRDAIDSLRSKIEEKQINLSIDDTKESAIIFADDKRMQQLFSNLIHNAIKFTPRFGHIRMRIAVDHLKSSALFSIEDDGQGIEANFLPHVFDQFKQENMETNRSYGGLGLGLAICKTVVEQHSGEIKAFSAGRGKGATFQVSLPLFTQATNAIPLETRRDRSKPNLNGLKVLVVDDSYDNLNLFRLWLHRSGAEVQTLSSAKGVVEKIQEFKPHVLLSDISMPGEDGFSLISKIRELAPDQGGKIPAGAITANARTEDRNQSISAGFQVHIAKPVTNSGLIEAVQSLADMNQMRSI